MRVFHGKPSLATTSLVVAVLLAARGRVAAQIQPAPGACFHLRYPSDANALARLLPSALRFSPTDSLIHFGWDSLTADLRELRKQTRGVGKWRRLNRDSIRTVVYESLDESWMTIDFVADADSARGVVRF